MLSRPPALSEREWVAVSRLSNKSSMSAVVNSTLFIVSDSRVVMFAGRTGATASKVSNEESITRDLSCRAGEIFGQGFFWACLVLIRRFSRLAKAGDARISRVIDRQSSEGEYGHLIDSFFTPTSELRAPRIRETGGVPKARSRSIANTRGEHLRRETNEVISTEEMPSRDLMSKPRAGLLCRILMRRALLW